ncbi:hypothetical protein BOX15_Mlig032038g1, partial [Macrostomum lignano]
SCCRCLTMKRRKLTLLLDDDRKSSGTPSPSARRRFSMPPSFAAPKLQPVQASNLQLQWSRVGDGFRLDNDSGKVISLNDSKTSVSNSPNWQKQQKRREQPLKQQQVHSSPDSAQLSPYNGLRITECQLEERKRQKSADYLANQKRLEQLEARYEELKRLQQMQQDLQLHQDPNQLHQDPSKLHQDPNKLHQNPNKLHQDPNKLHQDSNKLHQDPSKLHQSTKLHQDPNKLYQDPNQLHQDPKKLHQDPNQLHQDPSELHQDPNELHQDPSKLHQDPNKLHQDPNKLHHDPNQLHQNPSKLHQDPNKLHQDPSKLHQSTKLHQDPNQLHQDSNKLHQDPSKLHQSTKLHQDPNKLYQDPNQLHQDPKKLHQDPNQLHQDPSELHQDPNELHQDPSKLHQDPNKLHQDPNKLHHDPNQLHQNPSKLHQDPNKLHQDPSKLHQSTKLHQDPNQLHQDSNKLHQDPSKLHQSTKLHQDPNKLYQDPNQLHQDPSKLHQDPNKLYQDSNQLHQDPSKLHQDPNKLHQNPNKLHQDPKKLHQDPKKLHQDPNKLHRDPTKLHQNPKLHHQDSKHHQDPQPLRDEKPRRRLSLVLPPTPKSAPAQSPTASTASPLSTTTRQSNSKRSKSGSGCVSKRRRSSNNGPKFYLAVGEDSDALALAVDEDSSSASPKASLRASPLMPDTADTAVVSSTATSTTPAVSKPVLSIESSSSNTSICQQQQKQKTPTNVATTPPKPARRLCLLIDDDENNSEDGDEFIGFNSSSVFDSGGGPGARSRKRGQPFRTNSSNSLADRATRLARLSVGSVHMWRHAVDAETECSSKREQFVTMRVCQRFIDHGMLRLQCRLIEDPHLLLDGLGSDGRPVVCHVFLAGRSGVPLSDNLVGKRKRLPPIVDLLIAKPFRLVPVDNTTGAGEAICLTEIRRLLAVPAKSATAPVKKGVNRSGCGCGSGPGCVVATAKLPNDWLPIRRHVQLKQQQQSTKQPPVRLFDASDLARQPTVQVRLLALSLGKYTYWPADGHALTHRILALTSSAAFIWLRVRAVDARDLPIGYVLSVTSKQDLVELSGSDQDSGVVAQFDLCRQLQRGLVAQCQLQLAQFLQASWQSLTLQSLDCRCGRVCPYSSRALLKPPAPPLYTVGFSTPAPSRCNLHGLLLRILYDCPMRLYIYSIASNQVVCTRATEHFYLTCDAKEGCVVNITDCLVIRGALYCDRFSALTIVPFADADLGAFEYVQASSELDCKIGQLLELPPCHVTVVHKEDAYAWPVCPICFACRLELADPSSTSTAPTHRQKRVCGRCGTACDKALLTRRLEVSVRCDPDDWPSSQLSENSQRRQPDTTDNEADHRGSSSLANVDFRLLLHPDTAAKVLSELPAVTAAEALVGCRFDSRLVFVSRAFGNSRYQIIEASFDLSSAMTAASNAAMAAVL